MADSCATCFFAFTAPTDSDPDPTQPRFAGNLFCNRHAPAAANTNPDRWLWPLVKPDFWCGDFLTTYPTPVGTWASWTPAISSGVGTITTSTVTYARFVQLGKIVSFVALFGITTNGTGATSVIFTLPITPQQTSAFAGASGSGQVTLFGYANASAQGVLYKYDGTYPGGDNSNFYVAGTYEAA